MPRQYSSRIETFPRRVGSAETIIGIDLHLEHDAPNERLPWVNSLRVSQHVNEDDEPIAVFPAEQGSSIEDRLFSPRGDDPSGADKRGAIMVGSIVTLTSAEWFVYSAKPCAEQLAVAVAEQFPRLKVEARAQHDPRWSIYREFLLPSHIERHMIRTRRQVRELAEAGQSSDRLRAIDHTLWFGSPDDRNAFAEMITDEGFALHYPDEDLLLDVAEADAEYGLTVSRHDRVNVETMDELVRWMFKKAAHCGGEYEGWHVQIGDRVIE